MENLNPLTLKISVMETNKATRVPRALNRLTQAKEIGRSAIEIAAEEAMTWDVFRWTVIVLLFLNLFLYVFGGGPRESAQTSMDTANDLAALRTELNQQLAATKAEMDANLIAAQFGLRASSATESEPATGTIEMPSVPMPAKSPRRP